MTVELVAPAKVTVSLRVTGVRADGFHLIDAEMITVDLRDSLFVSEHGDHERGSTVLVKGRRSDVTLGEDNLVKRALMAAGRSADIELEKRIPAGAGLGGGSADAAAVLRWAGVDDVDVAVSLGADVPFCVVGGRARVRGIGEQIEPLPFVERTLTLVTPDFGCSTPEVYAMYDRLGAPTGTHGNDLEPAALAVEPRLAAVRDRLEAQTGQRPRLAGSGSTWFVDGAHDVDGGIVVTAIDALS